MSRPAAPRLENTSLRLHARVYTFFRPLHLQLRTAEAASPYVHRLRFPPSRRLHDSAYMCQRLEEITNPLRKTERSCSAVIWKKKKKKKACFCSRRSPSREPSPTPIIKLMVKEALLRPLINFSPYEYQVSCFYNRQLT